MCSVWLLDIRVRVTNVVDLGIVHRSGDHIASTRPLAEIDQPATLATERELRIGAQDDLAAIGTSQRNCVFLGHMFWLDADRSRLHNPCHQIVIVRFHDLAAVELAFASVMVAKVVDVHCPVDFRGVHCGSALP